MYRDSGRYKTFSRRSTILFGGKLLLLSGLVGRMYYLQIIDGQKYKTLSDDNRISVKLIAPKRGRILDRFGRPMAINQQNYRVMIVPENASDINFSLKQLSRIINIPKQGVMRVKRKLKRKRRFLPIMIKENLEWDEVAKIEANSSVLPGIEINVGESRYYPAGAEAVSVLGYVASVTEKELTGDPLLELPGFRIGKAGIEKTHDLNLRGKGGTSQVEVNAYGRQIRELDRREGQQGAEAYLTLDMELQKYTSKRLGNEAASAVVMNVHTGEVLALASTPGFDPNAFNRGLSQIEWQALIKNPRAPLSNKAIAGQYAPGSTFKMIVALAALKKGVITPKTKFKCTAEMELGETTFHCWKKDGHGYMSLVNAITQSCDVYFYEIAMRTGIDEISAMARRLGLGETFDIELSGQRKGLIPTRNWKKRVKKISWQKGETLLAGIGQGFILTTPLQLVVMISRLVNGGKAVVPHLMLKSVQTDGHVKGNTVTEFGQIGVDNQHLNLMKKAMFNVTNSPIGTAYKARIQEKARQYGGKTGTVQVRRISKAERESESGVKKNKDLDWKERDHALFVGYAPVLDPIYAVSVVVEHGGGGSAVAAPIARDILLEAQKRGQKKITHKNNADLYSSNSFFLNKFGSTI